MKKKNSSLDILCVGELLVDFISTNYADSFESVKNFERHFGGSPANLCMNMARLGNRTKLVATVGRDGMGSFLLDEVKRHGVDCTHLRRCQFPTTLILVTKTRQVAEFEAYRGADAHIVSRQLPEEVLFDCTLFHTTCFALSRQPARRNILHAARQAFTYGCQLSVDLNYAPKIWPDRRQAQEIVTTYCGFGAIVKVSEVDWERLYGLPFSSAESAARHFLDLGAKIVCVTMGSAGVFVASEETQHFLPARPIVVKDTTGAGDAFWSGFLSAWLDDLPLLDCAKAGRRMAEMKIGASDVLPEKIRRDWIYEYEKDSL